LPHNDVELQNTVGAVFISSPPDGRLAKRNYAGTRTLCVEARSDLPDGLLGRESLARAPKPNGRPDYEAAVIVLRES